MKKIILGTIVIVALAVGAGLLANGGAPHPAGHAAAERLHRPRATPTEQVPRVHRPRATPHPRTTATALPDRRLAALHHVGAHRAPVSPLHRTVRRKPVATVTVVDPASVKLPSPGPVLLLNPNSAAPGATIEVLGSGFDAGKLVTLTLDAGATSPTSTHTHQKSVRGSEQIGLDTAQAGRSGTFSKTVTLPSSLNSRSFRVVAQERKGTAKAVAEGRFTTGSPTATLSTGAGRPGDTVYASARGFASNEPVDVYLNNLGTKPVTTLHADGSGGLRLARIPVPYGPAGPTALLLLGQQSRGLAAVQFEMLGLYPTGSVSSYAAVADTALSFSASGFGPNEYVDVRLNTPDGFPVGRLHADSAGTIRDQGHLRIPFSLKGRNTFVLTGEQSHTSTTVTFTVLPYTPVAAPSSYGGGPGTAITFYGTGFARNETVRVWVSRPGGGRTQVATMRTNGRGNLIARPGLYLIAPNAQPGKLLFTLAGDKSVTQVIVSFTVQAANNPVLGTSGATGRP